MKAGFGSSIRGKAAKAAAAFVGLAAVAAVMTLGLPKGMAAGVTAGDRIASDRIASKRPAAARAAHSADEASATKPAPVSEDPAKARGKPLCAECGIIEAVQKIEAPLKFTGWCDESEIARAHNSGKAYGRDFRVDQEPLRETVAAAIAANRTTTKDGVTTRHRIVVRMRNGSRQVFEEASPRMVSVGDRMVVIAGGPRTSG